MDADSWLNAPSEQTGEATVAPERSKPFSMWWRSTTSEAGVRLSTPASSAHVLKTTTEQRAAMMITAAAEAEAAIRV
jgi:hypothetical protein